MTQTYRVLVTRNVTESAIVEVQAEDVEGAMEMATNPDEYLNDPDWAVNEPFYQDDPYLGAGEYDVTEASHTACYSCGKIGAPEDEGTVCYPCGGRGMMEPVFD